MLHLIKMKDYRNKFVPYLMEASDYTERVRLFGQSKYKLIEADVFVDRIKHRVITGKKHYQVFSDMSLKRIKLEEY